MSLRIYNTLSKQKDLFQPVKPGKVGIYLCGPTVYKPPHIGHMVGPVIFDAIKRYLMYKGYDVSLVVNITDVDDKIIDRANELGSDWKTVAEKATKEYHDCLALLGVDTIDRFPKASDHMGEIIEMSQKLIDKGFAYAADGNVWFEVAKDEAYGKLSNRKVEDQEAGTRDLAGSGKRNHADFALWKAAKPEEPSWPSPWGPGRPGWHIECSAMSVKYLGETFDLHGGGMDLMFPHHENELAQSECCNGKPFAKFWMHNGLTRVATKLAGGEIKAEKMSKSLGNVLDPVAFANENGAELLRYILLSTHYRSPIDFSEDVVASNKKGLAVFERLFERIHRLTGKKANELGSDLDSVAANILETPNAPFAKTVLGLKMKYLEMMDDDFNTAGAIAVLHELSGEINAFIEKHELEKTKNPDLTGYVQAAASTLKNLGGVIGLLRQMGQGGGGKDDGTLDKVMTFVIQLRKDARAAKNFAMADAIRDGLAKIGVTLEDRPDGTGWRKA
jgi:cysteinyl-tRNA synthetase